MYDLHVPIDSNKAKFEVERRYCDKYESLPDSSGKEETISESIPEKSISCQHCYNFIGFPHLWA